MNSKLNIIFCASGHLPSGSGEAEFEALYNREIKPLISALDKFPRINVAFHFSGVLLHWIERRYPELFMLLEDLLSRKQFEFLGGGFYNPMLPLLPQADKIGQIEMLTTYLRKMFGKRPQGCWLPAMAWEQNLVGPLSSCGMGYTFLEERQFSGAGVKPSGAGLYAPCITEDQGKLITVFPLSREMSAGIFDGALPVFLAEIPENLPKEEVPVVVIPLAGEAAAPDTSPREYEKLFEALPGTESGIEFTLPSKIIKNLHGLKKVYFPGGRNGGSGSHARQFLADHPEAGAIYAKMMNVHSLINNKLRGDKTRKRTAREELWKAQDSGVFSLGSPGSPGLVHAPVRKAAYSSLLEAEKITREKGKFLPSLSLFDYDLDGEDEYIFQDEILNCCVKPRGACVFELDYLPGSWNYLDTFTPESGERRSAFTDWLAPARTLPENLSPRGVPEARFLGSELYTVTGMDRVRRRLGFTLPAKPGVPWGEIEIEKTWQLKKNSLSLEYILRNTGKKSERFAFCPSIDLSFPGGDSGHLKIFVLREEGKEALPSWESVIVPNAKALELRDIKNETIINLETSRNCVSRIFQVPPTPGDFVEYQSTCLMPLFSISLEGGKSWKAAFSLKISS